MKIVFLGTPEFAAKALINLASDKNITIAAVITQPDRPVGKTQNPEKSAVKQVAEKFRLQIFQPENKNELNQIIKDFDVDFFVVVAFGMIFSKSILETPKYGCLNIHASILPKYRGASPIQTSLLNGDKETGISFMKMDEKLDHGQVYLIEKIEIHEDDKYESLADRIAEIGAKLLPEVLENIHKSVLKPIPQEESKLEPSYCHKIKKEDGYTDFKIPAEKIKNMIRAYTPWPQVYTQFGNKKLKLVAATIENFNSELEPGKFFIHNKILKIATSNGTLIPKTLQFEGKKEVTAKEFINGNLKLLIKLPN